nr:MAG: internal scaffolding protein [Microvirus sp.]
MKPEIRSAYSPREPVNNPLSNEPTRTKQEFVKEVDINEIVSRMRRGISPPPWMTSNTPRYGDFSNLPASFQEAYAIVEAGEAAFNALPLEFRRAIDHDPRNLDKAPRELFEQFGLLKGKNSAGASPESDKTPGGTPQASSAPHSAEKTPKKGVKPTPDNADD